MMEVKKMENKNAAELFQMKVAHVGINAQNAEQAMGWAKEFLDFFGLETRETPKSVFSGELVEIMKAVSFDSKIIIFDEPTSSYWLCGE